ncbi:MAG: Rieske 2Fe-2S domain-containing protein, partial [Gammaproteobacteria bacterium]|nr:Rieske 2Fe-2S domain-containing protein [Gammaproteobacteria bacterium]
MPSSGDQHDGGTPYLLNCWYAAAWGDELAAGPVARKLLDRPVALFRDAAGAAHAIGGRCPHRFAPLGEGIVTEDGTLQCPYHGLRFDGSGRCVHNPHQPEHVPDVAVPTWPVVERHGLVWIWFGDPARAEPEQVPDFGFMDE